MKTTTNELFENNIKYAQKLAYKFIKLYGAYIEHSEIEQLCLIGLFKASMNYNTSHNTKFSTYAYKVISNEVKMEVRKTLRKTDIVLSLETKDDNFLYKYAFINNQFNNELDAFEFEKFMQSFWQHYQYSDKFRQIIECIIIDGETQVVVANKFKLARMTINRKFAIFKKDFKEFYKKNKSYFKTY